MLVPLDFATIGCNRSTPVTAPAAPPDLEEVAAPPVTVVADDEAAVAALAEAGFLLTKNDDGQVIEFSVASDSDISSSFAHLAGVPNVQIARFTGPGITDAGMESLAKLTELKRLDLTDSAIGDETLQAVSQLGKLEAVLLRRTAVTDDGLVALTGLPKLRAVDLRNSNIADAGLDHLAKIKTLVDIQLEKSKVTDAGVAKLKDLPLKSFNVNYCTAVGDAVADDSGRNSDTGIHPNGRGTSHRCWNASRGQAVQAQTFPNSLCGCHR